MGPLVVGGILFVIVVLIIRVIVKDKKAVNLHVAETAAIAVDATDTDY